MKRHKFKRVCADCGDKLPGFKANGRWKADADHDLCKRCWRSRLNAEKAAALAG